jgi:hypothetical protein
MPVHCGLLAATHVCVSTVGGGNGVWGIVQIRIDVAASWPSEFGGFFFVHPTVVNAVPVFDFAFRLGTFGYTGGTTDLHPYRLQMTLFLFSPGGRIWCAASIADRSPSTVLLPPSNGEGGADEVYAILLCHWFPRCSSSKFGSCFA